MHKPPTPISLTGQVSTVEPRPWMTRHYGECAWPIEQNNGEIFSCCAPTCENSSYCGEHHRLSHWKPDNWNWLPRIVGQNGGASVLIA